ncbi:hypothetical protein [Segetibacter koreensis]|uniref:hypothetical protein n=1 Tax=Segetibacter koreensis TaxID=398037 RepID=UPI0012FB1464|nr:hypothetical protein [Segetibacter koreensis]
MFLFGLVALFKLFHQIFADRKFLIIAGIFLLPSTLFWCSGIHKDGLILSATGIIIYTFYSCINKRISFTKISIICFGILVVFALRNYVLFTLLPALLSWWLCQKYPGNNLKIFIAVYLLMAISALIISSIVPSFNFLSFIVNKQHEFLLLEGGSKVDVPQLKPTFINFISFLPDALDMAFLRPHTNEIRNISYIPAFVENILLLLLFLISPIYLYTTQQTQPVILVLFIFPISILLISGYTIPFTGAIVRYKSLVLPLLITPLLCINDFFVINKIRSRFNSSKFIFKKSY